MKKDYNEWENKLWTLYNDIFKDASYTITDGVVFPDKYASAPFKVMIMNREPYDEKKSYSLNQEGIATEIAEGQMPFANQRTMRSHLCQYLSLTHLLAEKGFGNVSEQEAIDFVDQSTDDDFVYYLSRAAYINIKKSDGRIPSDRSDLKEYANKGIEVLKEQIRFCNPSLILGGNVRDYIIDDLFEWGEVLYNDGGYHALKIFELLVDGKPYPFVDMFHPSNFKNYREDNETRSMSMYYLELFRGLTSIERTHPGYWSKFMNKECFETSELK